jgi:hypothetical protein
MSMRYHKLLLLLVGTDHKVRFFLQQKEDSSKLCYYSNESASDANLKGVIDLKKVTQLVISKEIFQLITPTRTYLLQTAEGTDIVMSF